MQPEGVGYFFVQKGGEKVEAKTEDRGLQAVLNGNGARSQQPEEIRTAEAIPAILKVLDGLPDAQVKNVFQSVTDIKQTANHDSTASIGLELNRLEDERYQQDSSKKKKKWFW